MYKVQTHFPLLYNNSFTTDNSPLTFSQLSSPMGFYSSRFLFLFFFLNPVPWTARVWAHCTLHVTISKFPGPAARVTRSLMTETTRLSRNLLLLRAVLALYSDTICTASLLHPLTVGCPKAQTLTFPFQNPFLSPRFHPCAGSITIIKHIPARHFPWTLSSISSCTQPLVWALSDTH